jgi:hypothetical protein
MSDETELLKHMHPQFRLGHAAAKEEAAGEIGKLRAEILELKETVIAFAGPWAVQYARDRGLPRGHLFATHYDILKNAGARMASFVRHEPLQE